MMVIAVAPNIVGEDDGAVQEIDSLRNARGLGRQETAPAQELDSCAAALPQPTRIAPPEESQQAAHAEDHERGAASEHRRTRTCTYVRSGRSENR